MTRRWKGPAPPDSGIRTGGVRDRALRAVQMRGPMYEDPEATRRSQAHWRQFAEQQKILAAGARPLGRSPHTEFIVKETSLPRPHFTVVTTMTTKPHRLQPFATFVTDNDTGEITDLVDFADVAAALQCHAAMVRATLKETAG